MKLSNGQLKQAITEKWDLSSETYDNHNWHGIKSAEERALYRNMLKSTIPEHASTILDVGCGTGELSMLLAEMGYIVTGIDLSEKMLSKAREKASSKRLSICFVKGDAENPPFEENSFDIVFNRHVLWTLPEPDKAIGAWKRVLKNEGRVMIIDGVWDDGSLNSKVCRFTKHLCTMVIKQNSVSKDAYSKEVRSALPNAGGMPLDKVKNYLEFSSFKNVQYINLIPFRDIKRKNVPIWDHIHRNYEYYMVFGDK